MTRGVPVLNPAIHLKRATPEKLARALFRRTEPLRPVARTRRKAVRCDQVRGEELASDEADDNVTHLNEGS